MTPLPIDALLPSIVQTVLTQRTLVLQAPPGAGKTTRVPWAITQAVSGQVLVLEPRRLAARMSAKRVADELNEPHGKQVGYEVRFERVTSHETRLFYLTEGVLTRRLLLEQTLRDVSCVIVDEVHERHVQADIALSLLEHIQRTVRPDLMIVAMSATLDAAPIAQFLANAPIITSEGRQFEVTIEHADKTEDRPLEIQIVLALRQLLRQGLSGHVLVFLPGVGEIRKAIQAAQILVNEHSLLLFALHGELSIQEQDTVLAPSKLRKVIFTTNVAETSVTIEGVVAVIDSGLVRMGGYNSWSGRPTLELAKISKSSAIQRAGRAGRTAPGHCLRLYSKADFVSRTEFTTPEIERTDFCEWILGLTRAGLNVSKLRWLTPPRKDALEAATALLLSLGAIDNSGNLTPLGVRMSDYPLHPRVARFLLACSDNGALEMGTLAAALLADGRDILSKNTGASHALTLDAESDLWMRLELLRELQQSDESSRREGARRLALDTFTTNRIFHVHKQLMRIGKKQGVSPSDVFVDEETIIAKSLLIAYPDRVAQRRTQADNRLTSSRELVLAMGGVAQLSEQSCVRSASYLVAIEADEAKDAGIKQSRARVWMASHLDVDWLLETHSTWLSEQVDVVWNSEKEAPEAKSILRYGKLTLHERTVRHGPECQALLLEKARLLGLRAFLDTERFERWLARLQTMVHFAPDLAKKYGLRVVSEEECNELLLLHIDDCESFADLRAIDWFGELQSWLGTQASQALVRLAPETWKLWNGRMIPIEYLANQPPSMASRLQDFFGLQASPAIADGRLPLALHLLAPNGRDVQVTQDLLGFWDRTYPAIRSELARRYPKHAWPLDPKSATPSRPGQKPSSS